MEEKIFNFANDIINDKHHIEILTILKLCLLLFCTLLFYKIFTKFTDFIFDKSLQFIVYIFSKIHLLLFNVYIGNFIDKQMNKLIIDIEILKNKDRLQDILSVGIWYYLSPTIFTVLINIIILYFLKVNMIFSLTIILMSFTIHLDHLFNYRKFKKYSKNKDEDFKIININYEKYSNLKKTLSPKIKP